MNFLQTKLFKLLLFSFITVVILLFFASLVSNQLLPQYSKSFYCASSGRGKLNFGYDKCDFITAYLYYIATLLTVFLVFVMSFLPNFRDDKYIKNFRGLALFIFKITAIILVILVLFFALQNWVKSGNYKF